MLPVQKFVYYGWEYINPSGPKFTEKLKLLQSTPTTGNSLPRSVTFVESKSIYVRLIYQKAL